MFTTRDEYMEATREASINSYDEDNSVKTIIFGLFIITALIVTGYLEYKIDINNESEFLTILDNFEVDTIEVDEEDNSELSRAMSDIVDESHIDDSSAYVQSLSKEVDRAGNS